MYSIRKVDCIIINIYTHLGKYLNAPQRPTTSTTRSAEIQGRFSHGRQRMNLLRNMSGVPACSVYFIRRNFFERMALLLRSKEPQGRW